MSEELVGAGEGGTGREVFGTDGIRDRVGHGWLAPAGVFRAGMALGRAIADDAADADEPLAVVGRDTRPSGASLEIPLVAGLRTVGVRVERAGVVPTPALAFLVADRGAALGICLTASHNPPDWNGLKVFGPGGRKATDAFQDRVESLLAGPFGVEPAEAPAGEPTKLDGVAARYLAHVRERAGTPDLGGATVAVDAAHGAQAPFAPALLADLGARPVLRDEEVDGRRINVECGALHPGWVERTVADGEASVGAAFDGDGDRVVPVDEEGRALDGDDVLWILARDRLARGGPDREAVVSTVMANLGLERALGERGIRLVRSPVGDRHLLEAMERDGLELGAEPSGHVLCRPGEPLTGDGLRTFLELLAARNRLGEPLARLREGWERTPQVRRDVPIRTKVPMDSREAVRRVREEADAALGDEGRYVLRYSGTEPVARVMVEALEAGAARRWADRLAEAITEGEGGEA